MGDEDLVCHLTVPARLLTSPPGVNLTPIFTIDQMQGFFESVVDNVATASDGSRATYDEALSNFSANSLKISLSLPSNYPIQGISTPYPDYTGVTLGVSQVSSFEEAEAVWLRLLSLTSQILRI